VSPYPEPHHRVVGFHSERSVRQTERRGPKAPQTLEVKRWMFRVPPQLLIRRIRQAAFSSGSCRSQAQNLGLAGRLTELCRAQPASLRGLHPRSRPDALPRRHPPSGCPISFTPLMRFSLPYNVSRAVFTRASGESPAARGEAGCAGPSPGARKSGAFSGGDPIWNRERPSCRGVRAQID
jgi:hypothetical protein